MISTTYTKQLTVSCPMAEDVDTLHTFGSGADALMWADFRADDELAEIVEGLYFAASRDVPTSAVRGRDFGIAAVETVEDDGEEISARILQESHVSGDLVADFIEAYEAAGRGDVAVLWSFDFIGERIAKVYRDVFGFVSDAAYFTSFLGRGYADPSFDLLRPAESGDSSLYVTADGSRWAIAF